ncbi:sugar ABC transporter permease [Enterococcus sp. 669A]|uniref:Sugar ABC transporter permease n=1 Tax=Candidatus Enterococcus moelleringii TaxID=2815325 RepID=A0ABS3L555_9ENTE|nr:sugar ABC transporter permease [Enterococcus sp. 669A]MBO1304742.1 sugar ABC transporter permease [Enterococcus sp. 669A]
MELKQANKVSESRKKSPNIIFKKYKKDQVITAGLFIAPLFLGIIVFYLIPLFQSIFYSFTKWGMFGGYEVVGLENYQRLLGDTELIQALKNTLLYAVFTVPVAIIISVFIAVLLNSKIKGKSFYRVIYFLPAVTMTSAVGMIWRWMFNSDFGIINQVLSLVGIQGPDWLNSSRWAIVALIIVGVWSSLGTSIVIFLSGLQGIPSTYYEAAEIDGAGPVKKFFSITVPLLSPTVFFQSITTLITALQVYDLIYMMYSQTNPALRSVQSVAYLFYRNSFVFNDKGYGAAIVVVLLVITLLITIVEFALQKKWVHYSY